ncbi:hypothetical protein [Dactylosporangium sp. CA-092794]|uniref:hypothetical protein n=1 Tax=Dactylosporangium sp. CA-092794 TaxID=3239929 RepID=UPI003D91BD01
MTELITTTQTLLTATAPFDLGCTLRAIAGFQPGLRDVVLEERGVRRAFTHPGDPSAAVVTEVTDRDDGAPGARLTVFSEEPLTGGELADICARVTAWLGLDDDRSEFLRIAETDAAVSPLAAAASGLHQVRFASLSEAVVYYALVQNSAQWYATQRKRRLTLHLGPTASVEGVDYVALPDLPTLSTLTAEQLLPFTGGPHRAARLAAMLSGVAALDEEFLRTGPYDEARADLLAVRGIGTFTAHALLLRALGRPDAVPLELEQFANLTTTVYGAPPPSPADLRARYGPWIGWWAYTCRTALSWQNQDRKSQERADRARQRPPATRRPRQPAASTRPRTTARDRQSAPWTPSDPTATPAATT